MSRREDSDVALQRRYYAATARRYEAAHVTSNDEHYVALALLLAYIDLYQVTSVLDVGSGTGRAIRFLKTTRPELRIVGIEPVEELRHEGYALGLGQDELMAGDAMKLAYADGEFDLVTEFGMLHHVREPNRVVREMLRVAKRGIYISDSNNFGQGSFGFRSIKQIAHVLGLWPFINFLKTGGKGYSYSEGDGIFYSYSVYDSFKIIKKGCATIRIVNTVGASRNPYRDASHVALLALKGDAAM